MPASRTMASARATSARVWPFSRLTSTASLSDSTAETMKTQPSRPSSGKSPACSRMCSTLAVKSKVRDGSSACIAATIAHERRAPRRETRRPPAGGAVQEIGIAEGDVRGPVARELPDVLERDLLRHDEEAAAIDRRNRTVQAEVQTPPARLHVADQRLRPVPVQVRVLLERGQRAATGQRERQLAQNGPCRLPAPLHAFDGTRVPR